MALDGERFAAPKEALLRFSENKLVLTDLEGGNGVFVRTRHPVEVVVGDQFLVGDQLLQIRANPTPDDGPDSGPTYFYASPRWSSAFRVVQLWEGGIDGATCVAQGAVVHIGRTGGDLVFSDDPSLAELHCVLEEQAGAIILTDLGSTTGTFVRVTGEREVQAGDELAIGRTRLRV